MGNLEESEAIQREVLEIRRRTLGEDHPETLLTMSAIASLVRDTGRLGEAEALFLDTLERRRRVLGETHSSTLHTLAGYASILRQQGKVEEAIPQYQAALDGRRRLLGDDHPDTMQSIHNMSGLMHELERYDEAEALSREAIERCRRVMPAGHWYLGVFCGHLGDILADTGRFADAEPHLLEARAVFLATFGDAHDRTIVATRALADFYEAWHAAEPDPTRREHAETWRALAPPADADTDAR
jgi:tetratricopeptide (TPR) repeat protein